MKTVEDLGSGFARRNASYWVPISHSVRALTTTLSRFNSPIVPRKAELRQHFVGLLAGLR